MLFSIVKKNIKEVFRQKSTLILIILFPIVFISFFSFIFGGSGTTNQTYNLGIINRDKGFDDNLKGIFSNDTLIQHNRSEILSSGFANYFILKLGNLKYQHSPDSFFFKIQSYITESDAKKSLEQRNLDALLIFDENFTDGMISAINNKYFMTYHTWLQGVPTSINSTLLIQGDSFYQYFQNVQKIILNQMKILQDDFTGIDSVAGMPRAGIVSSENMEVSTTSVSSFTYMIPGFLVFGLMLTIGIVAGGLVRENENKTIERIRLARTSGWYLLLGALITQIILATFQIFLMVVTATVLGFKSQGNLVSIIIILILTEFFILGLGLIIAGFVRKAEASDALGSIIAAPVGFVSGSFMPLPHIVLIPNLIPVAGGGMRGLEIWDFVPTTHAVNAIRNISLYGYSFEQNFFSIFIITASGIILFILSVYIYSVRQLKGF